MSTIRRENIGMVFQDPMTALNPFVNNLPVGVVYILCMNLITVTSQQDYNEVLKLV